jgi:hypothetical protein
MLELEQWSAVALRDEGERCSHCTDGADESLPVTEAAQLHGFEIDDHCSG